MSLLVVMIKSSTYSIKCYFFFITIISKYWKTILDGHLRSYNKNFRRNTSQVTHIVLINWLGMAISISTKTINRYDGTCRNLDLVT